MKNNIRQKNYFAPKVRNGKIRILCPSYVFLAMMGEPRPSLLPGELEAPATKLNHDNERTVALYVSIAARLAA